MQGSNLIEIITAIFHVPTRVWPLVDETFLSYARLNGFPSLRSEIEEGKRSLTTIGLNLFRSAIPADRFQLHFRRLLERRILPELSNNDEGNVV